MYIAGVADAYAGSTPGDEVPVVVNGVDGAA
jgi:hypothetical protein